LEKLSGRCAVVTGAAGGIGLGMATAFVAEGMRVVLADRDVGRAQRAAAELAAQGAHVVAAFVDVADPASVEALADEVAARMGEVHLLCNNAGVAARRPIVETTPAEWEWIFGVNVFGIVNGLRAFLPAMLSGGGVRHVVNTGSMSSLRVGVMGNQTMYTASKFAVVGLTEALRQELEGTEIGVSVLLPGPVTTELARTSEEGRPPVAQAGGEDPGRPAPAPRGSPANWMDPLRVGPLVVEAVRHNRPFVVTHPELWPPVDALQQRIADAFGRS
jgi:NAD(P)-dependent dehydrogenase (short-subunit alcohol dehydrogenase family)